MQMRKASARGWTREKEKAFLTALGETCNVTLAAQEAGVSAQHAYKRRKSHAAFRAGWIEAIGIAYGRLELILLDRALNGTEKIVTRRDGSEERMVEYSNQVALALLKMHRETAMEADEELPSEEVAALRDKISKKLDRLREQEERRAAASGDAE
jgi:porphobilinogen deaminase